jgi:hypothetical protein
VHGNSLAAEIIVLADADCLFDPHFVKVGMGPADAEPDRPAVDAATGAVLVASGGDGAGTNEKRHRKGPGRKPGLMCFLDLSRA